MSWSDPIADMITRIRNAHMAGRDMVEMPHSKLKGEITRVLKKEGFIADYTVEGDGRLLRLYLKYTDDREPVIRGIKRDSRPGLRHYVSAQDIPRVLGGLGVNILTTSIGVMTGVEARNQNVGGELVCSVW